MVPVDAGRVLSCIPKRHRQALGPLLSATVRAHATSALLLKTMQGPHRATFVKLKRGFLLWSKLLPIRSKLEVYLGQMDVALIELRSLAAPSGREVAALCALACLTAFPQLDAHVLEATQVNCKTHITFAY
jgi:hypothetical protein